MNRDFDWTSFLFLLKFSGLFLVAIFFTRITALNFFATMPPHASVVVKPVPQLSDVSHVLPLKEKNSSSEVVSVAVSSPKNRIIPRLDIADHIPSLGKFIGIDLAKMKLFLYEDGRLLSEVDVAGKGKIGSSFETPSGLYSVRLKEPSHFSTLHKVYMPYSIQFFGNFFIHGIPYYPSGTKLPRGYSGGCIRIPDTDIQQVYDFAEIGTPIFVYDEKPKNNETTGPLVINQSEKPKINASAYLVADINSGDVYLEGNADVGIPIGSLTKFMTAVIANETISSEKKARIWFPLRDNATFPTSDRFTIFDLLYPLLLERSNGAAQNIASYYGEDFFVQWMNLKAKALGMNDSSFADPSGVSVKTISTPADLFTLMKYIYDKKPFLLRIAKEKQAVIYSTSGQKYVVQNQEPFVGNSTYAGGISDMTENGHYSISSLFTVTQSGLSHTVSIILFGSENLEVDISNILSWLGGEGI